MREKDLVGKTIKTINLDDGVDIVFTDGTKLLHLESSPERDPDVGIVAPDGTIHKLHGHVDLYLH